MSMNTQNSESGNILIYVILAIFLFGALIAILRGGGSQQNIDQESLILKVNQVRQYASELERGVQFILAQGHSESELRFAHPNHSSVYGDLSADTPFTRQVFHPSGGNVEWQDNDPSIQSTDSDWLFNGDNAITNVSTIGGTSGIELLAILPNVSENFCTTVNNSTGMENISGDPPQDTATMNITSLYTGTFTATDTISGTNIDRQSEGCIEGGGTPAAGTYHYYKVLLAR